ncbi:hydroxyethylthiazole kinase-like uncharacterized protein yjeF [Rhodovulum bhavnagarense]|uniref:ADP-dependent (S)-NAD(P)H-hydrate dehydratase n=1 Tax=Rhodovulum bhavnagarense TaxID=992286 RepID=A0A4R2RG46_9RHOB|nr:hydroxyethylthiazole kinase-like uncharacterized protein yjeF [Rhodovulum bhavnagarense]
MWGEPRRISGGPALRERLAKRVDAHKYAHGHALVLAGGLGRTGAARLAARGALRVGAGLVTVAAPPEAMAECAAQLTSVMLRQVEGGEGLVDVLKDRRVTALCLGPGLGCDATTRDLAARALATGRAAVLDADALGAFEEDVEGLFSRLHPRVVLTPHGGEFARLFPDLVADGATAPDLPLALRVGLVRAAARRAGAVVALKGPETFIAAPDGRCMVHDAALARRAPWLATAGAGDVLAGMIAGLMARGFDPIDASADAVWLHVEAARHVGPGLIAEDLPEALPAVFRALGL